MAPRLDDPAFYSTGIVVIDFEALTPKGRRPEPTEVAAVAGRLTVDGWQETGRYETFINPPPDVVVTEADTRQTGITSAMLAGAPSAATALKNLEQWLSGPTYLLVAQSAHIEAGLIHDQAAACPALARIPFLCTVRMAKAVLPELPSHRLDDLMLHLGIPKPPGQRHRAMPDVVATVGVFLALLERGIASGTWTSLATLQQIAGITPKSVIKDAEDAAPRQEGLFEL